LITDGGVINKSINKAAGKKLPGSLNFKEQENLQYVPKP
jgi:hypothetical protein